MTPPTLTTTQQIAALKTKTVDKKAAASKAPAATGTTIQPGRRVVSGGQATTGRPPAVQLSHASGHPQAAATATQPRAPAH